MRIVSHLWVCRLQRIGYELIDVESLATATVDLVQDTLMASWNKSNSTFSSRCQQLLEAWSNPKTMQKIIENSFDFLEINLAYCSHRTFGWLVPFEPGTQFSHVFQPANLMLTDFWYVWGASCGILVFSVPSATGPFDAAQVFDSVSMSLERTRFS